MQRLVNPIIFIALAVCVRLLPHSANMAPIAAMALFGGVYLNKKYALVIPLIALFLSDIFLGFYAEMPFVYGSFLLIGLLGLWLRQHRNFGFVVGVSLFSSLLFFIITNLGVWLLGTIYPHTVQGLLTCYIYALPFFRNTVVGDLLYVGLFFGSYELLLLLQRDYVTTNTTRK